MSTVIWVHGTGVRQAAHDSLFGLIAQHLIAVRPDVLIRSCYWGERGARLNLGGASIPDYATSRAPMPDSYPDEVETWSVLYVDPTFELSALTRTPQDPDSLPPSYRSSGSQLRESLMRLGDAGPSADLSSAAGLGDHLGPAGRALMTMPEVLDALDDPALADELSRLLARAIVAEAVRRRWAESEQQVALDGSARDVLVQRLAVVLSAGAAAGAGRSVGSVVGRPVGRLAVRVAAGAVARRRGALHDVSNPMTGDVLLYLSHGAAIRQRIHECIEAAPEQPVTLLAHSLGGVACADLLMDSPRQATQLITVGSQAPYLYEIGALPGLAHPAPLPPLFPEWINVFDPRDLLAFVGADVFPGRVRDVPLDGRQPFPQAHSAYWSNPQLYRMLAEVLP